MKIFLSTLLTTFALIQPSLATLELQTPTQFTDENNVQVTVEIFDQERVSGEEFIILKAADDREPLIVKVEKPSEESLTGAVFLEDESGEILRDETYSLSFGVEFQQVLEALLNEDFKAGFSYLPAEMPVNAMGFLMIVDNLSGEMRGYHLVPKN